MESPDVIVVGAGLSGLAAARELTRSGLDVLVLEARDRPGGRTGVMDLAGVVFDTGGEWVDEAHTELRSFISDLGLEVYPYERRKQDARWRIGGKTMDEMPFSERDARVYERMNTALSASAASLEPKTYWRDTPENDVSVEEWLRGAGMSEDGIHVVETLISTCGSTVPPDRMSFLAYAVKVATRGGPGKGNEYRVWGGAGGVARAAARELGGRVRYSSPVTDILQDRSGVEVRFMAEDGPRSARARRAVMAVPFTVYPTIRFHPGPPPVFRRMISGSTYGVVRKMAFVFDEAVGASRFTLTDTQLGYLSAAQDPETSEGSRGIVSFAGGRPLLAELGLPEAKRRERAVGLLRRLYDVPEPARVVEKVWAHDYWTRGSYMILAPGDPAGFGEAMGGSFGHVRLAGAEAVAAAPSFMNSAVKGGIRAARAVADELGVGGYKTPSLATAERPG